MTPIIFVKNEENTYADSIFFSCFSPKRYSHGPNEHPQTIKQRIFTNLFCIQPSEDTWATAAQNTFGEIDSFRDIYNKKSISRYIITIQSKNNHSQMGGFFKQSK
jgi:hypothetical protein